MSRCTVERLTSPNTPQRYRSRRTPSTLSRAVCSTSFGSVAGARGSIVGSTGADEPGAAAGVPTRPARLHCTRLPPGLLRRGERPGQLRDFLEAGLALQPVVLPGGVLAQGAD